jgi:hypothetical protein
MPEFSKIEIACILSKSCFGLDGRLPEILATNFSAEVKEAHNVRTAASTISTPSSLSSASIVNMSREPINLPEGIGVKRRRRMRERGGGGSEP